MNPNPFSFGNPVSDPSRFFGRERELRLLKELTEKYYGGGGTYRACCRLSAC